MKAIYTVLMLSNLQLSFCASDNEIKIKLINDILVNEHQPTSLIYLADCWKYSSIKKQSNELMVQFQFISIDQTTLILSDYKVFNTILIILDLNCYTADFTFSKIEKRLFAQPLRWLIIEGGTEHNLTEIPALVDSNIIFAKKDTFNKNQYILEQVYKIALDTSLIIESYGSWNLETGLNDKRVIKVLSKRRRNLNRTVLRASIVITNNDTVNHLADYKDRHIDSITKVNYVLVNHLMDSLNATKNFTFVSSWGYKNVKTNRWNGMIGELIENKADIGGTALFFTPDRIPIIDYLSMTTETGSKFVFRAPPLSYVANIYLLPFNTNVWLCCGFSLLLFIFVIIVTAYLEVKTQNNIFTKPSDVLLLVVGAVCQMGSQFDAKTISGRISFIFLFIALLFLYTSYTANIVALLQSTTKSIKTLDDLLNSQMDFGVDDTIYNRYYFSTATEPSRKRIYETKIAPPKKPERFMNITDGVARMRRGLFAFHMELGSGYKLVEETFFEHEKCGLIEIGFIQVIEPWLAIQKNSPYKEMIKTTLFKIRESGLQIREVSNIYTKRPKCLAHGQNFESVRLTDCMFVVILLGYGLLVAVAVYILESIYYYKIKTNKIIPYKYLGNPYNDVKNEESIMV